MQELKKIRWGVIGSGGIARRRTIPEGIIPAGNAQLTAVFGTNTKANAQIAKQYGVTAASSLEALLETDIEAVYIASPPGAHRDQTLACARARKHVLCEKPLGLSVADAETMTSVCALAGMRLGTAFMMRFNAQHQAALDLIQKGALGQLVFARAQLSCWYPPMVGAWRQDPALGGGGALMDMGGHCIDLLQMFFGSVRAVSCLCHRTVHGFAVEDSAVVSLQFGNGALGMVDTFYCIPDQASQNRLELYGSGGSILAKGTIGQGASGRMMAFLQNAPAGYAPLQNRGSSSGMAIAPPAVNPYRAEIEEFSRAILENREPRNSGALGLQSQRVLAACYDSAETGKNVQLTTQAVTEILPLPTVRP